MIENVLSAQNFFSGEFAGDFPGDHLGEKHILLHASGCATVSFLFVEDGEFLWQFILLAQDII